MQLVHRRLDRLRAAPFAELVDPPLGQTVRRELGTKVAAALVGVPHPRDELVEDAVVEARRRDHDTLLLEPARVGGQAAGLGGADVGVVSAGDGEARARARDERDVGQVRAAGERVVEDPGLARARGRARAPRRRRRASAPRWTGMCSAWAIIRPRASKSAVEQSRRSLMFAEKAERTRAAPISSAIERSDAPITWSSIRFTESARSRDSFVSRSVLLVPSLTPTHPGGSQHVAPSSSRTRRARGLERLGRGELERGPRAHFGGADGDELDRPLAVGVAVARLVGAVEAPRRGPGCSGTASSNDWPR